MNWQPKVLPTKPKSSQKKQRRPIVAGGLSNFKSRAAITDLKAIRRGVRCSCEYATHIFSQMFQTRILWDDTDLQESLANPQLQSHWLSQLRPVLEGKFKGVFTREHILTLADLCYNFFAETERDILIWGACQSAKTIILAGAFLLLPVLGALRDQSTVVPVIDVPNRTNLSLSVVKELESLFSVYSQVKITLGRKSLPLQYVRDEIMDKVVRLRTTSLPTWQCMVFQRNGPAIRQFVNLLEQEHGEVMRVRMIDEIHYGSGKKSIQRDMDEPFEDDVDTWRRIGVTATPSENLTQYNWNVVPLWLDERHFTGVTRYNGERLPTISGNEPPLPQMISLEDAFPRLRPFVGVKRFDRETKAWQTSLAETLVRIVKDLTTSEYPVVFLRPFNRVACCAGLHARMVEITKGDTDFDFLQYYGDLSVDLFGDGRKTTRSTIKEVLLDCFPPGGRKRCLVIAGSGRGQFGDSFPAHVKHFIDLTTSKSFWDAIIQSTLGRAAGFNKESIVYFSQAHLEEFLAFYDGGCKDDRIMKRRPFNMRTGFSSDVAGRPPRGRPSTNMELILPHMELIVPEKRR